MAYHFSDHPTLNDTLKRDGMLQVVGQQVKSCDPPLVIGIYGDWGSGKTSFLRALQLYLSGVSDVFDERELSSIAGKNEDDLSGKELGLRPEAIAMRRILNLPEARQGYPVIWFDAWRYQTEENPIIALLHEIRRQFSPGTKLWGFVRREAMNSVESALLALEPLSKAIGFLAPVAGFIGKAAGEYRKVSDRRRAESLDVELSTESIRRNLDHAIKTIVDSLDREKLYKAFDRSQKAPKGVTWDPRLTIVIDDLDRCEPDVALRLLEGIKVFLSLDHCVFVLGVNPRRLVDHIANVYQAEAKDDTVKFEASRHAAKDYLDKIVGAQYWFGLPASLNDIIGGGMPSVVARIGGNEADLTDLLLNVLTANPCLPPNPRRIKGFLNTLARFDGTEWSAAPDAATIIIFAYLNHFHPEIVRKIQYYEGFLEAFVAWCRAPGTGASATFEGLSPLPEFASTNDIYVDSRFKDPIYENVLHVQTLINATPPIDALNRKTVEPYILLK